MVQVNGQVGAAVRKLTIGETFVLANNRDTVGLRPHLFPKQLGETAGTGKFVIRLVEFPGDQILLFLADWTEVLCARVVH